MSQTSGMTVHLMAVPALPKVTNEVGLSQEVLDLAYRFGSNPTTFMALYDGFRHFHWDNGRDKGMISYIETRTAWIGAADPLAPENLRAEILVAFATEAQANGKRALMLPVSEALAETAREMGFTAVQIGLDPWLSLNGDRRGYDYYQMMPVARQLRSMGAKVEAFDPRAVSESERLELERVTAGWLESRKCAPLGFLNRLEPWSLCKHKRYFRLRFEGQTLGFLAAVPVPARKAWYFVDLVRLPDAPAGTTEMLVIAAMDELRREGFSEVTLGMSPLVPVGDSEASRSPRLYRTLSLVFEKFGLFYGFKSLYNYKKKFRPEKWEASYLLILSPGKMGWRESYGLFNALFPSGLLATAVSSLSRLLARFSPSAIIGSMLSLGVVPGRLPKSWSQALLSNRATVTLALANLAAYVILSPAASLKTGVPIGFSLSRLMEMGFSSQTVLNVVWSSFYHGNLTHVTFNLLTLLFFVGFVESVAGSGLAFSTYLAGMFLANPLTAALIAGVLKLAGAESMLSRLLHEQDVGCSLGVFAAMGAWLHLVKFPRTMTAVITISVVAYAIANHSLLQLNHIVALGLGLVLARRWIK